MEAMFQSMTNAPGVVAARQAGAGFGGCLVAFVESGSTETFAEHVYKNYVDSTNIEPEIYPVRAAQGAGILSF